ncbi:MAG: MdtA/MuxA family multidrug efflux RND transporter periplasmic adaptor subunit [Burkholderiales bacterium]|jgi:multidrug efflux system membrane fusion protein|nr:MdtA/MuxA family multidrug efflux RND transporter periplasmic adaptor subunit [Burkholderiales bacterium]
MTFDQHSYQDTPKAAGLFATGKRSFGWLWFLVIAVALGGGGYGLYLKNNSGEKFSPIMQFDGKIPVHTVVAKEAPFNLYLNALGTVTAAQTVVVQSRVDGQLLKLHFTEGQEVKAGQLLAEIDPRPYQVQLTQTQGQMARDKALLENAKTDLERYRVLLKQDSVSQQQVDTQEALVAQYEGALIYDQGQIDSVKLNLDYTRITAPISGRLGIRRVDIGNMVRASDLNGLVVITQEHPIDIVFTINEADLPKIISRVIAGTRFPVEAWDRAQQQLIAEGVMTTIDNQIDVATGTVKVKAHFDNKGRKLFPNQFVNIRMKIGTLQNAVQVPVAAVQHGSVGTFVYIIVNTAEGKSTVSVRKVVLGEENAGWRVITEGLQEGDRVVIDGTDRLREGFEVDVVGVVPEESGANEKSDGAASGV